MRGVIEHVDSGTGTGTIRSKTGAVYPFARANLVRRSMQPYVSARVVFRLQNGRVYKMAVGPGQDQKAGVWHWSFWPWEWLLYLP